eukprot:CAMPEP_0175931600 /NCGR_PEP_ID=MMETSP0108-20121206/18936_1 /TAXON_ID=195067 ORGANISM="Goniomonas pacifica, Strain CCMP1869" /NCGR_SAMPLE_ID=MMETSP0108 /ASSEMBLY_ACC=CAM_ASM_000204 /LENGTH=34 /DNA_ID= /DNA_START= /DNA_END= /DNA_ORIENTATION=
MKQRERQLREERVAAKREQSGLWGQLMKWTMKVP